MWVPRSVSVDAIMPQCWVVVRQSTERDVHLITDDADGSKISGVAMGWKFAFSLALTAIGVALRTLGVCRCDMMRMNLLSSS